MLYDPTLSSKNQRQEVECWLSEVKGVGEILGNYSLTGTEFQLYKTKMVMEMGIVVTTI